MKILIIILINLLFNFFYLRISKKIIFTKYLLGNSFSDVSYNDIFNNFMAFNKELIFNSFQYIFVFMSFFLINWFKIY